jgi:hypothetical protein
VAQRCTECRLPEENLELQQEVLDYCDEEVALTSELLLSNRKEDEVEESVGMLLVKQSIAEAR